uniref:Ubiquitin-like domain-containing protein n=1 Tax=Panagrolaimus superbus TaxID=310955 RepID=A0A914XUM4_9BILA
MLDATTLHKKSNSNKGIKNCIKVTISKTSIDINRQWNILKLKKIISLTFNLDPKQYYLKSNHVSLINESKLVKEYNIVENDEIQIMARGFGGMQKQTSLFTNSKDTIDNSDNFFELNLLTEYNSDHVNVSQNNISITEKVSNRNDNESYVKTDDKSKIQCWNKSSSKDIESMFNNIIPNNDKDDKKEKPELNRSTLSLHIAAYENAIEDILDSNEALETTKLKNKTWKDLKQSSMVVSQNPFEFPRQQHDEKTTDPEVMQFKSSQILLRPDGVCVFI